MSRIHQLLAEGDLRGAREAAEANPALLREGAEISLADAALRAGQYDLLVQFLRLGVTTVTPCPPFNELLRHYLRHLALVYPKPARGSVAESAWNQLHEGSRLFFEDQMGDFALAES